MDSMSDKQLSKNNGGLFFLSMSFMKCNWFEKHVFIVNETKIMGIISEYGCRGKE